MERLKDTTTFIEKLEAMHQFPGPFMFKVIGDNTDVLLERAVEVVRSVEPAAEPKVSRRESKGARHQSITLVVEVRTSQSVVDIYAGFSALEGIKFML